ncbi:MAG: HAD hydrolase-like protein [Bacteroidales bacterium]|nr:HAD hydrolase-like protein [Candidatus Equimonas faecalis]
MINYDLTKIRAFCFDVDGVLSGNIVLLSDDSQPQRTANIKDGYALHHAARLGYPMAIITGGKSPAVRQRYEGLGLSDIYDGVSLKLSVFQQWLQKHGLQPEEVIYMGDDVPDYEVMRHCGCPCCPADAAPEIRTLSTYVSHYAGGKGCVRDVVEQVLRAQGRWMDNAEAFGW